MTSPAPHRSHETVLATLEGFYAALVDVVDMSQFPGDNRDWVQGVSFRQLAREPRSHPISTNSPEAG
jgi:hypothetical protein